MSILVENLSHIYMQNSPFESTALDNVNLSIQDGEFIGIIGHTGSGKSTLIQHLNGLLKPTSGRIVVNGVDITKSGVSMKSIRQQVGIVFQYPEHQLFEETIYKDVAFGPSNLGLDKQDIEKRVRKAMDLVGLDFETMKDRSPFDLSGGQRRRVAIAGVIAMEPTTLILDEPTAGLDPMGRNEILGLIDHFHKEEKITVIMVSHSMEDISKLADRIIVMNKGKIELTGTPAEVFKKSELLESIGLDVPQVTKLVRELRKLGKDIPDDLFRLEDVCDYIIKKVRSKNSNA